DLPSLATAQAPDWNDGRIVYQSRAGLQILAADASAPGLNDLLYFDILKQYHQDPDWQPDGGAIVFQQREAAHWEIFAINPDGSGRHALTRPVTTLVDALPSNVAPAWSPDGGHIAFLSNRTAQHDVGPWRVWVMAADGSNPRPLPLNIALDYGFGSEQILDWGP
ncbi:MAG: PD40 domain-containing protein, partial [Caldilinea sp.]|nr:PD40 domain-containing protein [Caldilinea sp.]